MNQTFEKSMTMRAVHQEKIDRAPSQLLTMFLDREFEKRNKTATMVENKM